MQGWLTTARTVFATALVTSAAWLIGGTIWYQHERAQWIAGARAPVLFGGEAVVARAPTPAHPVDSVRNTGGIPRVVPPPVTGKLAMPVAGVSGKDLVDTFTQARAGGARIHDAIDIMAPRGASVRAAAAGKVEKLFLSEAGGKTIYVRSPDGKLIYYYAHLDGYAPGLSEGQQIQAGQLLGTVGSTGNANPAAPHLHFAVLRARPEAKWYDEAVAINPYPLLTD